MELQNKKVWVIMSKDRQVIAKGSPRNRHLSAVKNLKDRKRILTYHTKRLAESAFTTSFFYQYDLENSYTKEDLEAVEVELVMNTVE